VLEVNPAWPHHAPTLGCVVSTGVAGSLPTNSAAPSHPSMLVAHHIERHQHGHGEQHAGDEQEDG